MPRHDATNRVVKQSLQDIEDDIKPRIKRRSRSNTRYTSISVESSNVSPMSRSGNQSRRQKPSRQYTKSRSTRSEGKSNVVALHETRKRIPRTTRTQSRASSKTRKESARPGQRSQSQRTHVIWYPKRRARLLALVLLVPFVLISMKLAEIQILDSDKYASMGVAQRVLVRDITPERGTITDRNGNILAVTEPAFSIIADPSLIDDPDFVLSKLSKITVFDEDEVAPRLNNKKSRYAVVARHVDEATKKRVQSQSLPGISVIKDNKREYPGRDVAANVIGFVGTEMNGLGGIEFMLDSSLSGKKGKEVVERDPQGREIPSNIRNVEKAVRGNDVMTTIDQGLQYEAQRVVVQEVGATRSKGGTAIVADIKTGEILTMVSVIGGPDNPVAAPATDRNYAVTDVYEPGSTNKVITVAGALEEKIISPSTTFTVADRITFDEKDFVDHDPHEPMVWTAGDILRESSNVGTIMISNQLKKRRLDSYMRQFGFGSKSALNFPGEAKGILLDPDDWSDTSIATVPIGNGLAVTPLQMLSVYMTIANGGIKVEPKLIRGFIDENGDKHNSSMGATSRVISERTASQLQTMLRGAVSDGTGKLAHIPGYSVAGKTGTARKPPYNKPPYKYIASFAGFAPASNPSIAAIVVLDEPQGQIYGGSVAAPVFSRVVQSALRVMGVQSDQAVAGESVSNLPSKTTTTTTAPALVP